MNIVISKIFHWKLYWFYLLSKENCLSTFLLLMPLVFFSDNFLTTTWDSRSIFPLSSRSFFKVDFASENRESSEAFECRFCFLSLLILRVSLDLSFLIFWVWPKMRYPLTPSSRPLDVVSCYSTPKDSFLFPFFFLGKCFLSHKTANLMFVLWNSNSFGKALHLNVLWVHFMLPNAKTFLLFIFIFVCVGFEKASSCRH